MTQNEMKARLRAGGPVKDAVIALAPPLPVMTSREQAVLDVEVHANVLALVEAYGEETKGRAIPWASLLAAAAAVPSDHALLRISTSGRTPVVVRDAVTDLMNLGLMETGTRGLRITEAGCQLAREWNGDYSPRRAAARQLLQDSALLPAI